MFVVEVAIATFNGERFLRPLLDSLFAQTFQQFAILISDDGSTDTSLGIIADYENRYPGRIRIIAKGPRHGVLGNFARLFEAANARYLMPCDQDDVWLPRKIELSLERMRDLEAAKAPGTPILVHTDLTVVGEDLEVLGRSFVAYSGIDPMRRDINKLLLGNVVTGCATMVNRPLYQEARPIPTEATMYDHWLALVAASIGVIDYIAEPTILYRQHCGNAIGARQPGAVSTARRISQTLFTLKRQEVISRYSRQAEALLERFGARMAPAERRATETLARIWGTARWRRFGRMRKNGLALRGLTRSVALFIVVARGRPRSGPGGDAA